MGRLVKAFSEEDNAKSQKSIEDQFLREAGALAEKIQQELRDETVESASGHRQLGRDANAELDNEWARLSESGGTDSAAPDGLRIFTGSDDSPSDEETPSSLTQDSVSSATNDKAEDLRRELMEELAQEQSRWTERHAMQVRSIEEQARQLAQADAEVELREQELDRRERELDARTRELASHARTETGHQASRSWESTQQEMDRLAAEVRLHADRASQFEAELIEVRREHAIELDGLRSQLSLHNDSRVGRAKSVIDECDQRMSELTAQRAAWQAEQSRRREELARERLEQREEFRQQRDVQLTELTTLREEIEKKHESTTARLDKERREWNEKFTREQDELIDLKRAVESEAERVRADLAREKTEWESHQEHMRSALRQEQLSAQELLNARMKDADRLKEEHTAKFESLQKEFESERAVWHRERGQEAAILQAERNELESEADRLRAERSLIETERQQLTGELEQQRTEHEESLRESWRSHQASLQQAEQETSNRQRVLTENLQQQQNELAARMQQAEHEIRSARELCAKQIAQDKERFAQTCATHEAELERERAELNVQRQQLEREKLDFADEMARTRTQTEQERSVIRNSLSQMDAQLRVATSSLLSGLSATAASEDLVEAEPQFDEHAEPLAAEPEPANSEKKENSDVAVWEPGKEPTLVDTTSSDLIRRFDAPSESGGVAGLERRPRIASHGVLAQAVSDATAAEVVYDENDHQIEWAGTVAPRGEDTANEAAFDVQNEGRRQALESYRSKLSSLQNQLRQLSNPETDDSESDLPEGV